MCSVLRLVVNCYTPTVKPDTILNLDLFSRFFLFLVVFVLKYSCDKQRGECTTTLTTIAWTGFRSDNTYITNEELPVVTVEHSFFDRAEQQKMFTREEFAIVRRHNYKLIIEHEGTGEQLAISTFGLPYAIFVAPQ